jgi:hypothetical protein
MTAQPTWDMTPLMSHARCLTTTAVADALKVIAREHWSDHSFELSDDNGGTQLVVAQITLDPYDVDRDRAGSLAESLFTQDATVRAMTLPDPGFYVVTIDAAGHPTGYEYIGSRDARLDFDYARSRW